MENKVRRKLETGANLIGMMHFTGCPMLIEVMASAGMDFTNIDMEHSPIDIGLAAHLIRAADAVGMTPFVRVPSVEPGLIMQVLNLGATGIIIPHANIKDCVAAVSAVRYAPEGIRGSCPAIRAAEYGKSDWAAWTRHANREVTVIPLLEEKEDIDRADEILAIDGIDIVFMGPFDYSVALGIPGANFDHPKMAAALEGLVEKARRRGKYVMTSVGARIDTDYARSIFRRGVRLISYSADALVFQESCKQIAATRD
ncbi:MAG: aldolase [Alphaproteobacteria bacterium]|nr:aldolase [Alphaproteobacteria bacterium]